MNCRAMPARELTMEIIRLGSGRREWQTFLAYYRQGGGRDHVGATSRGSGLENHCRDIGIVVSAGGGPQCTS